MWWLYQILLVLVLALAGPLLLVVRGRHYLPTLAGRFGLQLPDPPAGGRPLWIHAVSVGETLVAATLARSLPPGPLVVTTITPTGQARARAAFGSRPATAVSYLPFDLAPPLDRFLARLDPTALILVEGDYWPLVLARARRRGMPVAVVNGRVGDTSFRRLRRVKPVLRLLFAAVDRFAVQSEEDRRRLTALGVAGERVTVTGNLKYDSPPPAPATALTASLAGLAAGRPLLVAGSTMPGEEAAVIAAHRLAGGGGSALLVIAPRHPERWDEVERLLAREGLAVVRRSALGEAPGASSDAAGGRVDVVLLDSLGELAALYGEAAAAFVGGTLVSTGGHNPLEPARFGVPTAVGPSMDNFRQMAEDFDRAGAWERVTDAGTLGETWRRWLADPAAARLVGERARRLVEANRGATARTVEVLAPLLAGDARIPR
ncbi:MAG TPA: 3-deoxy-D-manno-octulosonic acid transferase [Thermoanaerobaculia bacterium]|nr:3-deoxy-D-manno-octulosonic acid transferase [Thermoanaerobaculia bacterium]